ncbi:hypothetical protein BJY01DRAFT_36813 [Aspergillus pseudoustus]|uniref:Major facilitator superfamily (MFS) profile domain-containing protein n=1 Tax=Aspergillus pseudoustus TaxID=1810923 RepID=A0ABR4KQ02_9EURO
MTPSRSTRLDTISYIQRSRRVKKKSTEIPRASWSLELRSHDNHESLSFLALLMPMFLSCAPSLLSIDSFLVPLMSLDLGISLADYRLIHLSIINTIPHLPGVALSSLVLRPCVATLSGSAD